MMTTIGRTFFRLHAVVAMAAMWAAVLLAPAAAAAEPEARQWDQATASALLAYIEGIGSHGLDPGDYAPAQLRQAMASGDPATVERQATRSFGLVAEDLAIGHVKPGHRGRYYIAPNTLDPTRVARMIEIAISAGQVSWVLDTLAPQNPEYAALRAALETAAGAAERRQVLANLERWRWLPHNPGVRYVMVNIPDFRLRLMENGREISAHRVIVGKRSTPTPQFSAQITAVILNPSWHVPQSIIAESVGRLVRTRPGEARNRGYTWSSGGSGRLQVTQQPGPTNALGQLKLEMANPLTVYIHDTPNKDLFERDERTFSHGCIRTQAPFELGEALLAGTAWTREAMDRTVETRQTTRAPLAEPVPVYVVYMTAVPQADGTVRYLGDPYNLDAAIAARLAENAGGS